MKPLVIIMAYDRFKYVEEAVASARQDPIVPEVVVVSNCKDPLWKEVINIYMDVRERGPKLWKALSEVQGDPVMMLDDDDKFREGKVSRVSQVFKNHNLGFLRNSYEVIDEGGKVMEGGVRDKERYRFESISGGIWEEHRSRRGVIELLGAGVDFNNSTMSFSRDILENSLDFLRELPALMDSFIFLNALLSPKSIYLERERLTLYRIGSSNVSVADNMERYSNFLRDAVMAVQVMEELVSENRGPNREVGEFYVSCLKSGFMTSLAAFRGEGNRFQLLRASTTLLWCMRFKNAVLASVGALSPRLLHQVFRRNR